jgi:hypothetical protein
MATALDAIEWIDAGADVLRSVGLFGAGYDRAKVTRFQKANNVFAGVLVNGPGTVPVPMLDVDGIFGPQTAGALRVLLRSPPQSAFPASTAAQVSVQWRTNGGAIATQVGQVLAARRAAAVASIPSNATPPAPNATTAASNDAQAAVDAATDPLTAPPAPESPAMQPPPDVAPPGPQPPAPEMPSRRVVGSEEFRVLGMRKQSQGADVPWFAIGLGVLAFAGVIGWAAYRKRQRSRS